MGAALEDLTKFLSTYPKEITDHLKVVENDNNYGMLHISNQRDLLRFIPRIGYNQIKSEDRTIPRVCVARTLAGCILSYQRTVSDSLHYDPDRKMLPAHYYIKRFEYMHTLVPDKELVCDVDRTGEEWLVAYSPDTASYIARNIGEVFVYTIRVDNASGAAPIVHGTFLAHVVEPVVLDDKTVLSPGFWTFDMKALYGGTVAETVTDVRAIHPDEYAMGRLRASSAKMPSLDW